MSRYVPKPQSAIRRAKAEQAAAKALVNTHVPESDGGTRTVVLTRASEIAMRPVKWLLDQRMPLGMLTLLAGREGIGKSLVAYTYAADITHGRMPGTYQGKARAVIVAATEDSWEHTIVPRLVAAGADLARVYRVDVTTSEGVGSEVVLPRDLAALGNQVTQTGAALILLDPLISRLDSELDTHKDAPTRQALEPLVALAHRTGAAVLGIIHVNKSSSTDALTTVMGSRAFVAVARSVLFVAEDPEDPQVRVLGMPKNNLASTDVGMQTFSIVNHHAGNTPEGPVFTGKVVWGQERSQHLRDLLESAQQTSENRTATEDAAEWMVEYLTAHDGTAESKAVKAAGRAAGYSSATLGRARPRAGVVAERVKEFQGASYWSLPGANSDHSTQVTSRENDKSEMSETSRAVGSLVSVEPLESDPPRARATPAQTEVPGRAASSGPEKARKSSPPTPPRKRRAMRG